eukprot:scaffold140_cov247-Pinguiococcus_pyrenoidosus.AAC.30
MAEHLRRRARLRRAEGAPQDEVDDAAANFAVELGQVVGLRLWSLVRTASVRAEQGFGSRDAAVRADGTVADASMQMAHVGAKQLISFESETSLGLAQDTFQASRFRHRLLISSLGMGGSVLEGHTVEPILDARIPRDAQPSSREGSSSSSKGGSSSSSSNARHYRRSFRVMSYNIWNVNPPSWHRSKYERRKEWYAKRMQHLARVVKDSDPDILGLQEVRLDETMLSLRGEALIQGGYPFGGSGVPERSQVALLAELLPSYQFYWQPAMTLATDSIGRQEEGLAIFSKFPIVSVRYEPHQSRASTAMLWLQRDCSLQPLRFLADRLMERRCRYALLPMFPSDPSDDHQRLLLVARIALPPVAGEEGAREEGAPPRHVEVVVTHWSLSEAARLQAAETTLDLLQPGSVLDEGADATILLGDLNAEPGEAALAKLVGAMGEDADTFEDAFRRASTEATGDPGFTFPVNAPSKRIDYILVRPSTRLRDEGLTLSVANFAIHGKEPVASKATRSKDHVLDSDAVRFSKVQDDAKGLPQRLAMQEIWASDHLAVAADVTISTIPG